MQELKSNNPKTHFCFFSELTREQISMLNLQEIDKLYKKGESIFKENGFPKALYVVYKGAIKVHKYGNNGKEQITRLAGAGDLLGYRSLLQQEPYSASATAIEDTRLFKIPSDSFFNLIKSNTDFAYKIIQLLSDDLKHSEKKLINMAQKSVREKIAETLILMSNRFGINEESSTIKSILSRKEIADIAGVTTESTIRTISDFNKEDIIKIEGKKIVIRDFSKLENVISQ